MSMPRVGEYRTMCETITTRNAETRNALLTAKRKAAHPAQKAAPAAKKGRKLTTEEIDAVIAKVYKQEADKIAARDAEPAPRKRRYAGTGVGF